MQLETTIRDFPITTGVWAIGSREEDKWHRHIVNLGVHELELQRIASIIVISWEAISRQPQGSVWDRKNEWKTGGRYRKIS
jgi:hypothetical protein